jgi:hypothetical protein
MLNRLKTYWPVAILVLLMLAVIDGTFSSLLTCRPTVSSNSGGGADQQQAKEYCTAFSGPILITIKWLARITHKYEGLITAAFTIVLAVFTARLWFSTEKLSESTKRLVEGAEDTARRQLRAYIVIHGKNVRQRPGRFISDIEIVNTGQTPAYDVIAIARTAVLPFPLPSDFDFTLINPDTPSTGLLGPGQSREMAPELTAKSHPRRVQRVYR